MARPLAGGRPGSGAAAAVERSVETRSTEETIALGRRLGRVARPGDLVCLWGDLGAGKTQLAKGFALGLGIDATITSPTFILMAEYPGRIPLFHVDLYRLADAADALAGGVIDDRQADGLTVVEWPDRMGDVLPAARLDVRIDGSADEPRTIAIVATADEYRRYVEAAG
jgi:tRNA threonylcarbamoyladenosine biosynthesis protein TsaE